MDWQDSKNENCSRQPIAIPKSSNGRFLRQRLVEKLRCIRAGIGMMGRAHPGRDTVEVKIEDGR